jgi:hypothetical protein
MVVGSRRKKWQREYKYIKDLRTVGKYGKKL